jgi:hypothetical protein
MDGAGGHKAQVIELDTVNVNEKTVLGGASGRVFKGALYSGHANFEWLLGQFLLVQQVQSQIPKGQYLFELIHPQSNGLPIVSDKGRYCVKLWILDTWRAVTVDDRIPLDLFGRPLFVASRPLQLWPMLLSKALLKVMAAYHVLEQGAPNQVRKWGNTNSTVNSAQCRRTANGRIKRSGPNLPLSDILAS